MKRTSFLIAFLTFACGAMLAQKTVELPPVAFANTRSVEISKVTLSEQETVLHIEAFFTPGFWIKITSESYLNVDNTHYMIKRGEGIELDSLFWMPASGEASFKLVFEPLPKSTKTFDFIEGDCEGCFKLYGIDLQHKRLQLPDIPVEYTQKHLPEKDFDMTWDRGNAIVRGQMLGYKAILGDLIAQYINPITGTETEIPVKVDADGIFKFSIPVVTPTTIYLRSKVAIVPIRVAPRKASKILINLPELYRADSKLHKNSASYGKKYYYSGYLARLNTDLANDAISRGSEENFIDSIADMDANAYKKFMMQRYNKSRSKNNTLNIEPFAKKIVNIEQIFNLFNRLEMADYILMDAYAKKYNLSRQEARKTFKPSLKADNFYDYYQMIPYNDPDILLATNVSNQLVSFNYCRANSGNSLGVFRYLAAHEEVEKEDQELLNAYISAKENNEKFEELASISSLYGKYKTLVDAYMNDRMGANYLSKIWNTDKAFMLNLIRSTKIAGALREFNPLTDEQKQMLTTYPPIIQETLLEENEKLLAKIEENKKKTGYTVLEVPDVSNETLFAEMIKPFKGKAILIDIWATWCGPCRMANKEMEPVKAQLADKDIVFLYLSGENSPENTWRNMIPDLHGYHYRLSNAQWEYVSNQLKASGIPTYIVLDKEGKQTYHAVGFHGAGTIKQELLKVIGK